MEKSKKLELGDCKLRYDNQISIVNGELQLLQGQVMRFKRERDTYKHMLESAQKTIGDLKNSPKTSKDNTSQPALHYDEVKVFDLRLWPIISKLYLCSWKRLKRKSQRLSSRSAVWKTNCLKRDLRVHV